MALCLCSKALNRASSVRIDNRLTYPIRVYESGLEAIPAARSQNFGEWGWGRLNAQPNGAANYRRKQLSKHFESIN